MRFAIINSTTLKVVNVCEWEGGEWLPPFGTFVVQEDRVGIDDIYDPISNNFKLADRTAPDVIEEKA